MTPPAKRGTESYQGKGAGFALPALPRNLLSACQLPQVKVFSGVPAKQTHTFSPMLGHELDDLFLRDSSRLLALQHGIKK